MDFVDVEYTEVQDEPITDTWYTCPACGCLNHSGSPCDCGYDPRRAVAPKKRRKRRPSVAVIVLSVALLASLAVNVAREISYSDCRAALLDALSLYANNACVVPTNSRMYHRDPICSKCDLSAGYWIYNTELALSNGYRACPSCSVVRMPILSN